MGSLDENSILTSFVACEMEISIPKYKRLCGSLANPSATIYEIDAQYLWLKSNESKRFLFNWK